MRFTLKAKQINSTNMELLRLDNGGLMDSKQYKQHLRSIRYHNNLIDRLAVLKSGSSEYAATEIKIRNVQEYINRDLARVKEKADKMINE